MKRHFTLLECDTCGDRYPAERHEDSIVVYDLVVYDLEGTPFGKVRDWTVWSDDESPQCQRDDAVHQRNGGNLYLAVEQDADQMVCSECHILVMGGNRPIHTFCQDLYPDERTVVCDNCGSTLFGDEPARHVSDCGMCRPY